MKKAISLLGLILLSICSYSQPVFVKDSLDRYVERGLKAWQVPGAAVAIVKDGKIVLAKGYGVRESGSAEKVDQHTLFMIGSNTKAFTAVSLAMLAHQKVLSLNDPVIKWIPDFKMTDPYLTKEANIRDLLCHRLGFQTFQGDFMFFDSDLTSAQIKERLSKMKPMFGFRSRWGYTNAAFMLAGEVIEKSSGSAWHDYIDKNIFTPLKMNRSLALSADISDEENKASAHTVVHGKLRKIPYGDIDGMAPAGSISSSVSDMSNWVMMLLDSGKFNGQQIVPYEAIQTTMTPHSILGNGGHSFNQSHFLLYGLGWFLEEYEGRKIVSHTGGVNGFVTSVCLIPEERLGIIVLTNTDANGFFEALRNEIQDAYLQLPYRNYSGVNVQQYRSRHAQIEKQWQAQQDTILSKPKMQLPISAYTGNYKHDLYGEMTIAVEKEKLVAKFEHHPGRNAILEPLGKNRFLATFSDPLLGIKTWLFTVKDNKVKSVTVTVADFVEFTPYEFEKAN